MIMRKFSLTVLAVCMFVGITSAQESCMALYPKEKGSTLVTKCYDANNNELGTTTYTVIGAGENYFNDNMQVGFTMVDNNGDVLNQGVLQTSCEDGDFFMKSVNHTSLPNVTKLISSNVNLMAEALDYPDTFSDAFSSTFKMDGGEFTIHPKKDKKDFVKVRVFNRSYDKNEKITTPAGTFDASKITYSLEVYDSESKETKTFKNIEWYAPGAGIVRSEAHDKDGKLENYTVLASLSDTGK